MKFHSGSGNFGPSPISFKRVRFYFDFLSSGVVDISTTWLYNIPFSEFEALMNLQMEAKLLGLPFSFIFLTPHFTFFSLLIKKLLFMVDACFARLCLFFFSLSCFDKLSFCFYYAI